MPKRRKYSPEFKQGAVKFSTVFKLSVKGVRTLMYMAINKKAPTLFSIEALIF